MPASNKDSTPRSDPIKIRIRDRAHVHALAAGVDFGGLFKHESSVAGFSDWLFLRVKIFDRRRVVARAQEYVRQAQAARAKGVLDFEEENRASAEQNEQIRLDQKRRDEAIYDRLRLLWSDRQRGRDCVLAVVELALSTGNSFGTHQPPSWLLNCLTELFESIGGPDKRLHEDESERSQRVWAEKLDGCAEYCVDFRERARDEGYSLTRSDYVVLRMVTESLSSKLRIRMMLRALARQVVMIKRIEAAPPAVDMEPPSPPRSRRAGL